MFEKNYIIHYKPNTDRKKYLLENEYLVNSETEWRENFQHESDATDIVESGVPIKISPKELLVFLSHRDTLRKVMQDNVKSFIVWEDDVLINDVPNVSNVLKNIHDDFIKSDADILFLGKIPGLEVANPEKDKYVYTNVQQCSVCTHAYSIKIDKVVEMNDAFEYNLPVDHDFTRVIQKLNLKVAWTYPAFEQGTITSKYNSNLR